MATSLSFPNMFDVSRNSVGVLSDNAAVVNRCRLLILTEQGELFNSPRYGVGLKRHLWKYNNENEKAIICDRVTEQLRIYEPCCIADETKYSDTLLFTETESSALDANRLKMSIILKTVFGDTLNIDLSDLQDIISAASRLVNNEQ